MRTSSAALTAAIAPATAVVAWLPMHSTPSPAASNPLRVRGGDGVLRRVSRRRRKSSLRLQKDDSYDQEKDDRGDFQQEDPHIEDLEAQRANLELLLQRQNSDLFDSTAWSTTSKTVSKEEWALFQQFVEDDDDSYYEDEEDDDLACDVESPLTLEGVAVGCTTEDCEQCDIPEEFKLSTMESVDVMAFLGIRRAKPIQAAVRRPRLRFYEEEEDDEVGEWN